MDNPYGIPTHKIMQDFNKEWSGDNLKLWSEEYFDRLNDLITRVSRKINEKAEQHIQGTLIEMGYEFKSKQELYDFASKRLEAHSGVGGQPIKIYLIPESENEEKILLFDYNWINDKPEKQQ